MARRRLAPGPPPTSPRDVPRAEHLATRSAPPPRRSPGSPPRPPAPPHSRELSETLERARDTGRMVLDLPLDAIAPDHLARDRIAAEDAEMATLRESIRAHGQRSPIEVTPLGFQHRRRPALRPDLRLAPPRRP